MAGAINNLAFDGKSGAQIQSDLNVLASTLRNSVREWEAGFNGIACFRAGDLYFLRPDGNPLVDPIGSSSSDHWSLINTDGISLDDLSGTYLQMRASAAPLYVVTADPDDTRNGLYYLVDGIRIKNAG